MGFNFQDNGTKGPARCRRGALVVQVDGDFGSGGSLAVQVKVDGADNFVTPADGTLTADGVITIPFFRGDVQFVLSGATSPDLDLNCARVKH